LNFETVSLSDLGWVLNEIVKLDLDLKNLNLFMSAMHHARCDSLFVSLMSACRNSTYTILFATTTSFMMKFLVLNL